MKDWIIPQRYLKITLYDGRIKKTNKRVLSVLNEQFKISGDISSSVSGASSEANFTINGLNLQTMSYLSTSFSTWVANQIQNEIEIDIGYQDNHSIVYRGNIIEAVPSLDNADYSIKLKCLSGFSDNLNNPFSISFSGLTRITTIGQEIASKGGYGFRSSNSVRLNTIQNYQAQNMNLQQHLRNLAEVSGLDCYIQNDLICIKKSGEPINSTRTLKVDVSNMIGNVRPTNEGCKVKVKLNPLYRTGMLVKLNSVKFPTLSNNKYVIQTIATGFDTRGVDWYNELVLVNEGLYRQ